MKKKITVLLLAVFMAFGLCTMDSEAANIVGSGSCGEKATWTLDSEGTLRISGTGKIKEKAFYNSMWRAKQVIIEEGITGIGDYAFYDCSVFGGTLNLPSTVTTIGNYAFGRCSGFSGQLVLPNGLESIGDYAFENCDRLTGDLIIPKTVKSIGDYAFYGCRDLSGNLVLSEGLKSIGASAFHFCDGLKGDLVLPNGLESVGDSAFYDCMGFDGKLVLPDSLTSIGKNAFSNCTGLTGDLILPKNLKSIKSFTFNCCINLDGRLILPEGLESIEGGAFWGCIKLDGELILPKGLTEISSNVFYSCNNLDGEVILSKNISTVWGDAFYGCDSIEKFILKNASCLIADSVQTFPRTATIAGYKDSTAYEYAVKYDRVFEELESSEPEVVPNPFKDVAEYHYYYNPVLWALQNNVTSGISATEFGAETVCTRGQVITFIWRANGSPMPKSMTTQFADIQSSDYYYKAILWAVENGIASGSTATTFAPNAEATRGQIVTFLWRAAGKPAAATSECAFKDVVNGAYYYKAVLWAVENNITAGTTPTTFAPDAACTRGQVVTFLYRAFGK